MPKATSTPRRPTSCSGSRVSSNLRLSLLPSFRSPRGRLTCLVSLSSSSSSSSSSSLRRPTTGQLTAAATTRQRLGSMIGVVWDVVGRRAKGVAATARQCQWCWVVVATTPPRLGGGVQGALVSSCRRKKKRTCSRIWCCHRKIQIFAIIW